MTKRTNTKLSGKAMKLMGVRVAEMGAEDYAQRCRRLKAKRLAWLASHTAEEEEARKQRARENLAKKLNGLTPKQYAWMHRERLRILKTPREDVEIALRQKSICDGIYERGLRPDLVAKSSAKRKAERRNRTPEETIEMRERSRKWRAARTPEQKEHRKAVARSNSRIRRAAKRLGNNE